MPTVRPRYQVTETAALTYALDRAAVRWPGEPRSALLLRLIEVGVAALDQHEHAEREANRAAVMASSGAYPDAFDADYLATLREDWPA